MDGKRYYTTSLKQLAISVPGHQTVKFIDGTYPSPSDTPVKDRAIIQAIESSEWFGCLIFEDEREQVQVDTGDEAFDDMVKRAHVIARRNMNKKPEAIQGMINSEGNIPVEDPVPVVEPDPLPTAGEINFMKKRELVETVAKYGIDADVELPYNALKKQVRDWRASLKE